MSYVDSLPIAKVVKGDTLISLEGSHLSGYVTEVNTKEGWTIVIVDDEEIAVVECSAIASIETDNDEGGE